MSDYSKCDGDGCPRRDRCLRYRERGYEWGSSFSAPPGCEEHCNDFDPVSLPALPALPALPKLPGE